MKLKHLIILILSLLAALLIAGAVAGAVIFYKSSRYGEVKLQDAPAVDSQPTLGKRFELTVDCILPHGQNITVTSFAPGEGVVQSGEITVKKLRSTLRGSIRSITVPLKAYRTGKLDPGTLTVTVERPFFKNGTAKTFLKKTFAAVEIMPREIADRKNLPLADAVAPPEKAPANKYLILGAIIIVLLIAAIWFITWKLRHKKLPPPLPPWEQALLDIGFLRKRLKNRELPLAQGVAILSDIVRNYLSNRFHWRTSWQTTEEFFMDLKRKPNTLTEQQSEYLTGFMSSADMVKFANIKPSFDDFIPAMEQAEKLIRETSGDQNNSANSVMEAAQ